MHEREGRTGPFVATAQVADGTNLRTLHWPPIGPGMGTVLIVHGLGEHAGRYQTVASALTAAGLDVHGYDHRGNGGSGGRRNHVERWSILHDDLAERIAALRAAAPDLPFVLYGHSMGGLVACGYVLAADDAERVPRPMPDLLVLSSPGLGDRIPTWKRRLAAALTGVVPKLRIPNGLPPDGLSRDPGIRAKADADALCSSSSTIRFGAEAFAEQDRVRSAVAALDAMPMPTYVFHGSADPIVPVEATAAFEGMRNVTRHVHDGLRHETHHEPEHDHVLAEIVAWLATQGVAVRPGTTEPVAHHEHAAAAV